MIDSKVVEKEIYTSRVKMDDEVEWIQPSITNEMIMIWDSELINGIYSRTPSKSRIGIIDEELAQEMDAWESASDFDYLAFEKSLGE